VGKGKGMTIERRGTKAGHIYELLAAVVGQAVKIEPFLITLQKEALPYTGFRHAGVELIYMLSGEDRLSPRRQELPDAARRCSDL